MLANSAPPIAMQGADEADVLGSHQVQPDRRQRERDQANRSRWAMLMVIVAIPMAACVLSFFIADSRFFQDHADPEWVQSSDRLFTAHNVPCDIVVYGDSSAITGVDPTIVQRLTGLKTCNVALTKAALVVLGTSGLDDYLRHNPKPRYLVLEFTAPDFYQPTNWADTSDYMDGVIALLRFYPARDFLPTLFRHPEIFMGMMHYTYITGPVNLWRHRHGVNAPKQASSLVNVHLTRNVPAFTSCYQVQDVDPIFHKPDLRYIESLRTHYAPLADHLLIDASPTSECDGRADYLRHNLSGIDNQLETYPVQFFNEGYAHFTAQGSRRVSEALARQINALEAQEERPKGFGRSSDRGAGGQ